MNEKQLDCNYVPGDDFWKYLVIFRNFCVKDKYIWYMLFSEEPPIVSMAEYRYAFSYVDTQIDWYHEFRDSCRDSLKAKS